jgi:hypothetical protein
MVGLLRELRLLDAGLGLDGMRGLDVGAAMFQPMK